MPWATDDRGCARSLVADPSHSPRYGCGMRATIDKAGRVVIPKALRDRFGLRPGAVELIPDGSGVRIEPLAGEDVAEEGDRLVIPAAGTPVDDETVQALRDADQR